MGNSTITLQQVAKIAKTLPLTAPVINVAGAEQYPVIAAANDAMNQLISQETPWKWNEVILPPFYTNSYQQDYAVPGVTNLFWLQRGIAVQVNSMAIPKPYRLLEMVRDMQQTTAAAINNSLLGSPLAKVCWLPNSQLYYGTWGGSPSSMGNDPVAGSVYTNPLGPGLSQPTNPITQIQDANGNLLVLTTYGIEGSAAPLAAVNSPAGTTVSGTGATTQWTVVDPSGQGFRVNPCPGVTGTVWQFRLVGQKIATRFTNLSQTLDPIPDDFEPTFRQGVMAQLLRYSPESKVSAKFATEWALWLESIKQARAKTEHERDDYGFIAGAQIGGGFNIGYLGGSYPYNYPVT